tara:strand:- start:370 stop:735 length:366 start_codon:yes stop_codon:yes gene_type:complete
LNADLAAFQTRPKATSAPILNLSTEKMRAERWLTLNKLGGRIRAFNRPKSTNRGRLKTSVLTAMLNSAQISIWHLRNRRSVSKFNGDLSDSAIAVFRNFNTISFLLLIISKNSRVAVNHMD